MRLGFSIGSVEVTILDTDIEMTGNLANTPMIDPESGTTWYAYENDVEYLESEGWTQVEPEPEESRGGWFSRLFG